MSFMENPTQLSQGFYRLVKQIGESTSRQEEEQIVAAEIAVLGKAMKEPDVSGRRMKEYLVRAVYCEMLGFTCENAYIQAVNLTQQKNILYKRAGYLAASLFLNPEHELIILLVHSLQRDLNSTNVLEVCMALMGTGLLSPEYIPAVLATVVSLLSHDSGMVRKKAVAALHAFYTKEPDVVSGLDSEIRRALCDKDPAVMAATLVLILDMIAVDKSGWVDLIPSFVAILKQVADGKLAPTFSYHGVPAPWIQIQLLRIIGILCKDNLSGSESSYEVVKIAMHKADCGVFAGFSVVLEAVRTVATMYPNPLLLEMAAAMVSKFIGSPNNNLKYVGITALAQIVAIDPKYAAQHAEVVLDSLDGDDETLKRKTLDLLFKMTNPHNVSAVVERLLEYLRSTVDAYLRTDLVSRITNLAERYAPSPTWYVRVLNLVFEYAPAHVSPAQLDDLLRLIAEGTGDEDADDELRAYAVSSYVQRIDRGAIPDLLVIAIAWTLGEYAYLSADYTEEEVMHKLIDLAQGQFEDPQTRAVIITALTKLVAQVRLVPPAVTALIDRFSNSTVLDIQQRCYEFHQLVADFDLMEVVLPVDAANEDLDVDPALPFLDAFVAQAVANGAKPYIPRSERSDSLGSSLTFDVAALDSALDGAKPSSTLRFDAYENPLLQPVSTTVPSPAPAPHSTPLVPSASPSSAPDAASATASTADTPASPAPAPAPASTLGGLSLQGVTMRWGSAGMVSPAKPAASPDADATPSAGSLDTSSGFVSGFDPSAPTNEPDTLDNDEPTDDAPSYELDPEPTSAATASAAAAPTSPAAPASNARAHALFAGTSSSGLGLDQPVGVRIRKDRRDRKPRRQRTPASPGTPASPTPDPASSPAPASALGSAPAASTSSSLLDLFSDPVPTSPTQPAQPAQPASPASSAPLLALQPTTQAPPPSASPLLDLAGFGGGSTPLAANAPSLLESFEAAASGSGAAVAAAAPTDVLGVQLSKTAAPDAAVVVLSLTAHNDTVSSVTFTYQGPSGLDVAVSGRDGCSVVAMQGGKYAVDGTVEAGSTKVVALSSTLRAASMNYAINVTVSYRDSNGAAHYASIQDVFTVAELLRPNGMTTAEFGGEWVSHAMEAKASVAVAAGAGKAAHVSAVLAESVGLTPVDVINSEAILAGTVLGSVPVFVHTRVNATGASASVDITVRSGKGEFPQLVASAAADALGAALG